MNLKHIEKSEFRPGEYVAFLNGAHRVRRNRGLGWQVVIYLPNQGKALVKSAPTLRDLDARLEELAQEMEAAK